jgi:hypothetical protein
MKFFSISHCFLTIPEGKLLDQEGVSSSQLQIRIGKLPSKKVVCIRSAVVFADAHAAAGSLALGIIDTVFSGLIYEPALIFIRSSCQQARKVKGS